MSPLRTEAFHHRGNLQHLFPICLVGLEGSNLLSDLLTSPERLGRFHQRFSDRLGTSHSRSLEPRESSFSLFIESYGYRSSHGATVSHFVVQLSCLVKFLPTAAFADIRENRSHKRWAAEFREILSDMAGGGGMTATVMSADGT